MIGKRKRRIVYEVFDGQCFYCGRLMEFEEPGIMEIDHAWPSSRGGDDSLSNLVLSCKSCNSKKSNQTLREFAGARKEQELEIIWGAYRLTPEKRDLLIDFMHRILTDAEVPMN